MHLTSTYGVDAPPAQYGKGVCEECGGPVSTYTEPQPITDRRLCNRHWEIPEGYYRDADDVVRLEPTQGVLDLAA